MPVDHYENFPVASWLLPRRLRPPIEAIYAFARGADDLADEGDAPPEARLAALERYSRALDAIAAGDSPSEPPFRELGTAVHKYALPLPPLRDLLDAFRQDVTCKRYESYRDLMDYCRRSANPIGRLLLHLFGERDTAAIARSDAICSGLQLANHWQDVAIDWKKGRVYIPQEDLRRFSVTEADIEAQCADERWQALMAFQCARTHALLEAGSPLAARLPGRMGLEIRATVHGARTILGKIEAAGGDVFRHRPVLGKMDWVRILVAAFPKRGQD